MEKEGDFQGFSKMRSAWVTQRPNRSGCGWVRCHAQRAFWDLAHGFWFLQIKFTWRAFARSPPWIFNSPTNWATPSSCWRRFVRPPKRSANVYFHAHPSAARSGGSSDVFNAVYIGGDVVGETSIMVEERGRMPRQCCCERSCRCRTGFTAGSRQSPAAFVSHVENGSVFPGRRRSLLSTVTHVVDRPGTMAGCCILAEARTGSHHHSAEGHEEMLCPSS